MSWIDLVVVGAAAAALAFLAWFFFGTRKARLAEVRGDVQEVEVTVRGGYSPDVIRVRQGVPLRVVFDRRESGECTARVLFPDFKVNASLPAYGKAAVEFVPDRVGEFGFACGMNMVHGRLVVEPDGGAAADGRRPPGTGRVRRNARARSLTSHQTGVRRTPAPRCASASTSTRKRTTGRLRPQGRRPAASRGGASPRTRRRPSGAPRSPTCPSECSS